MKRLRLLEVALAGAGTAYLVGSGNWPTAPRAADRDYVTAAPPADIGRELARRFGGRAFVMDETRQYWRLVAPQLPIVDLAPIAEGDIGHDLSLRDFTMNAVATTLPDHRPVVDPFHGIVDHREHLVRQVTPRSLPADPLRVLRGLRLASEHGHVIEEQTWVAMRNAIPGLVEVKPERIRMELLRALQGPGWRQAAIACQDLEVWAHLPLSPRIMVERGRLIERLDRLGNHRAEAAAAAQRMGGLRGLDEHRVLGLAVLAAPILAAGTDGTGARAVGEQLRLSSRESEALAGMTASSLEMGEGHASPRQAYALLERYGAAAAWGAALAGNNSFPESVAGLHLPELRSIPGGIALADAVGRPPGAWLGRLVSHLRRAVALGELRPEEAAQESVRWAENARRQGAPERRRR